MSFPFYKDSAAAASRIAPGQIQSANVGLWFSRFYNGFEADWTVADDGKRTWIDQVARLSPCGDAQQIQHLLERQSALCLAMGGQVAALETEGNFVTGTGLSHPVENGFTFHPVLGTPYLPAAGVKGLLRGWAEVWMSHANDESKRALLSRWFGNSKGGEKREKTSSIDCEDRAGNYVFFDALPTQPIRLACDVMTPHMGKWYEQGGEYTVTQAENAAPADWHSPVPVPFLVVKSGAKFSFMIAPRLTGNIDIDALTKAELPNVLQELQHALEWLGAGAKTAAVYGRMLDMQAREDEQRAMNLAKAGIQMSQDTWEVILTWEKGPSKLHFKPSQTGNKPFFVSGIEGRKFFDALPEDVRKKLNNGKNATARVQVEVKGNQTKPLAIV